MKELAIWHGSSPVWYSMPLSRVENKNCFSYRKLYSACKNNSIWFLHSRFLQVLSKVSTDRAFILFKCWPRLTTCNCSVNLPPEFYIVTSTF